VAGAEFQILLILTALMPDARRELQNIIRLATHTALDGIFYTMWADESARAEPGKLTGMYPDNKNLSGIQRF
jgi:hypothetical protein